MISVCGPFNWIGGKGLLYMHIIPHIPRGNVYVEPFAGGASVFWRMEPMKVTVLNDVDGDIVNFYRVLQDKSTFDELAHRLNFTLYSREEFQKALSLQQGTPVDRAWAFFVRQNQGFGGKSPETIGNWGRSFGSQNRMAGAVSTWLGKIANLDAYHRKLRTVQIDNQDALDVIQYWDTEETVFYVDPPYVHSTRKDIGVYANELDDAYHERLVEVLLAIKGQAVLSGYDHEVYAKLESSKWRKKKIKTTSYISKGVNAEREEVLWIKTKCSGSGSLPFDLD